MSCLELVGLLESSGRTHLNVCRPLKPSRTRYPRVVRSASMSLMWVSEVRSWSARYLFPAKHGSPLPVKLSISAIRNFSVGLSALSNQSVAQIHTPLNLRAGSPRLALAPQGPSSKPAFWLHWFFFAVQEIGAKGRWCEVWGCASLPPTSGSKTR